MWIACALFAATPCAMPVAPRDDPSLAHDFCAIAAIPVMAGGSTVGDQADAALVNALRESNDWVWVDQRQWPAEAIAEWDRCSHFGYQSLFSFSGDRQFARVIGSSSGATDLDGAEGECYFAKTDGKWRVLSCFITAIS